MSQYQPENQYLDSPSMIGYSANEQNINYGIEADLDVNQYLYSHQQANHAQYYANLEPNAENEFFSNYEPPNEYAFGDSNLQNSLQPNPLENMISNPSAQQSNYNPVNKDVADLFLNPERIGDYQEPDQVYEIQPQYQNADFNYLSSNNQIQPIEQNEQIPQEIPKTKSVRFANEGQNFYEEGKNDFSYNNPGQGHNNQRDEGYSAFYFDGGETFENVRDILKIEDKNYWIKDFEKRPVQTTGELLRRNKERKPEYTDSSDKTFVTTNGIEDFSYDNPSTSENTVPELHVVSGSGTPSPVRKVPKRKSTKRDKQDIIEEIKEKNNEDDDLGETEKDVNFQLHIERLHITDNESQNTINEEKKKQLNKLQYHAKTRIYQEFLELNSYNADYSQAVSRYKEEEEAKKKNSENTREDNPNEDEVQETQIKKKQNRQRKKISLNKITTKVINFFIRFLSEKDQTKYNDNVEKYLGDSQLILLEFDELKKYGLKSSLIDFKNDLYSFFIGKNLK